MLGRADRAVALLPRLAGGDEDHLVELEPARRPRSPPPGGRGGRGRTCRPSPRAGALPSQQANRQDRGHREPRPGPASAPPLPSGVGDPVLAGVHGDPAGPREGGQGEAELLAPPAPPATTAPTPPRGPRPRPPTAFWHSSYDARPLTTSTCPCKGSRSASSAQPTTLSTALCRPTSSRTTSGSSPPTSNSPAACRPPVRSKTDCRLPSRSGREASQAGSSSGPPGGAVVAAQVQVVEGLPAADAAGARDQERPGAGGAVVRRRVGQVHGDDVEPLVRLQLDIGAVADSPDVAVAVQQALAQQPAGGQLEVRPRGPHGHGDPPAAQPDLERLLGGELVLARDPGGPRLEASGPHPGDRSGAPRQVCHSCPSGPVRPARGRLLGPAFRHASKRSLERGPTRAAADEAGCSRWRLRRPVFASRCRTGNEPG